MENITDFGPALRPVFKCRRHQSQHGVPDLFDYIINDIVVANVDLLFIGHFLNFWTGSYIEADDNGIGYSCQRDV